MDPHAEVEAKFDADGLSVGQVQELVDALPDHNYWRCRLYRRATGFDVFYRVGAGVFRYRRDDVTIDREYRLRKVEGRLQYVSGRRYRDHAPSVSCCLTVKQRKSGEHLLDRHEVDLWVGDQKPEDVAAFVGLLGGREEFRIQKSYHVWMIQIPTFQGPVEVCLALYDVCRPDGSDKRRFLEVEVEKHSACGTSEGETYLQSWMLFLQQHLGLGDPVNVSLQELYRPKESP